MRERSDKVLVKSRIKKVPLEKKELNMRFSEILYDLKSEPIKTEIKKFLLSLFHIKLALCFSDTDQVLGVSFPSVL